MMQVTPDFDVSGRLCMEHDMTLRVLSMDPASFLNLYKVRNPNIVAVADNGTFKI